MISRRLISTAPILRRAAFQHSKALYSTQTQSSHSDQKTGSKSSWGYGWRKWAVTAVALGSGYYIGISRYNHYPPKKTAADLQREIDTIPEYSYVHHHPYIEALRAEVVPDPDTQTERPKWKESRYYDKIPLLHRDHMLTSGLLKGKGFLTIEPLIFQSVDKDTSELVVVYHVGDKVDGHDGIVHGGFLATLMDEGLTRCGFPLLPNKYGVTASLEMNYRAPTPSNSYIVLKGKVDEANGRRVYTSGNLETLPLYHIDEKTGKAVVDKEPITLVEGKMLIVEPKWAKYFLWMI